MKWDGYRALGYVRGGEARLVSRNGNDLTARFPDVAKALAKAVRSPECVVDGEVCALDENGRPSFSAMQQGKPGTPLVYEVFDVLEIDGVPVGRPAAPRAARAAAKRCSTSGSRPCRSPGFFEDGEALYEAALEQGLEGVMAKRPGSRYAEGKRTRDWLKVKTHGRAGVRHLRLDEGAGPARGPLRLARARRPIEDEELDWVGNVGTGFTERDDRRAAREARAAAHRHGAVRGDPEDAEGPARATSSG